MEWYVDYIFKAFISKNVYLSWEVKNFESRTRSNKGIFQDSNTLKRRNENCFKYTSIDEI